MTNSPFSVIDSLSGEILRSSLTYDAAFEVVADSNQFPHAMKSIVPEKSDFEYSADYDLFS